MVWNDNQQEVLHGLFKEPILGPVKFKMEHGCLLKIVNSPYLDKQEAQLSQGDRATLRVSEYFAKSLKITQGHSK